MTISPNSKDRGVGPVLVTGGCGFLGYYLVGALLSDPEIGPVHVLDININNNTHPDANYIQGSVTDPEPTIGAVLDRTRPSIIFHAASPSATYSPPSSFYATNVLGTKKLLRLAREKPFVKALVYTSSLDIYANPPHDHVDETHPLWPERPAPWAGVIEYDRTKTKAHRLVLAANDPPHLKTVAIVSAHLWGVRDSQGVSIYFDTFGDPRLPVWKIGQGGNRTSCVEAGNCADAHILAAKALVKRPAEGPRVDGEAFNVTDGEDFDFWTDTIAYCRMIRGLREDEELNVWVIPVWVYGAVVSIIKWVLLIFTWGTVEPPSQVTRNGFSWCVEDHTMDDSKARELLGYRPRKIDRMKLMREAVEWEKQKRLRKAGKKTE